MYDDNVIPLNGRVAKKIDSTAKYTAFFWEDLAYTSYMHELSAETYAEWVKRNTELEAVMGEAYPKMEPFSGKEITGAEVLAEAHRAEALAHQAARYWNEVANDWAPAPEDGYDQETTDEIRQEKREKADAVAAIWEKVNARLESFGGKCTEPHDDLTILAARASHPTGKDAS